MRRTRNTFFLFFLFTFALAPASASVALININTADKAALMTLYGLGGTGTKAQAVIDYREAHGPFQKIEDIMNVSGIKTDIFNNIKDLITVGDTSQTQTQTETQTPADTQTQTTQTQQVVSANGNAPPAIIVEIDAPVLVVAGGGSYFEAEAYGAKNEPLSSATFKWNFGDGATAEGRRVFHTYSYPGSYVVVLVVVNNLSTANARAVVEAAAAQAALVVENDGSATLVNKSAQELNAGLWSVACGTGRFVVPEGTVVLAGGGVRFSPAVMKFSCGTDAQLLYPNGTPVAEAVPAANSPLRGEQLSAAQVRALSAPPAGKNLSAQVSTSAQPKDAADIVERSNLAAAPAEAGAAWLPSWLLYFIGLVALLVLGASAAWYARASQQAAETTPKAEEFEIYE